MVLARTVCNAKVTKLANTELPVVSVRTELSKNRENRCPGKTCTQVQTVRTAFFSFRQSFYQ